MFIITFNIQNIPARLNKMKRVQFIHRNCRNSIYPRTNIQRISVPDHLVKWTDQFINYKPIFYEADSLKHAPWADPAIDDTSFVPQWNTVDVNDINRSSHHGNYEIHNRLPLNVCGRTGIIGRGLLGRYGPNHAGDPIVTRWKRNINKSIIQHPDTNKNILQMLAIQRRDSNEWAIPGGMVDPGEMISTTLKREFIEEALNSQKGIEEKIEEFFNTHGKEIYCGYVDDPRNTDNAWIETVAFNFHDKDGDILSDMKFEAGDDAKNVRWLDIDQGTVLYANHREMIANVASLHMAHW